MIVDIRNWLEELHGFCRINHPGRNFKSLVVDIAHCCCIFNAPGIVRHSLNILLAVKSCICESFALCHHKSKFLSAIRLTQNKQSNSIYFSALEIRGYFNVTLSSLDLFTRYVALLLICFSSPSFCLFFCFKSFHGI